MQKKKTDKKMKIKRDLKFFMKDESGGMTKENVLKVGMGTIAALSLFSSAAQAGGPPCDGQVSHLSDNTIQWQSMPDGSKRLIPSHTHHQSHCSY